MQSSSTKIVIGRPRYYPIVTELKVPPQINTLSFLETDSLKVHFSVDTGLADEDLVTKRMVLTPCGWTSKRFRAQPMCSFEIDSQNVNLFLKL